MYESHCEVNPTMTLNRRRLLSLALAFSLLLSLLPAGLPFASSALAEEPVYGMTTDKGVNVRQQPSTSSQPWFRLP